MHAGERGGSTLGHYDLYSFAFNVYKNYRDGARRCGSASPVAAVKAPGPSGALYVTQRCISQHTRGNLLKCQRDKTHWIQRAGQSGVKRH